MTDRTNDPDSLIDQAAAEIRNQRLDEISERQATDRVWNKLSAELEAHPPMTGCADFQAEIPAYVAGALPEARALLVADHTRECVPCRRVLMAERSTETPTAQRRGPQSPSLFRSTFLRIAAAVVLILGGVAAVRLVGDLAANHELRASIQVVDGSLQKVKGDSSAELGPGQVIGSREVVRTAKDSGAMLELADGSIVEMNERTQIELRASRRGTTIDLARGNIIVHAADQNGGRLFVDTDNCRVTVKGTIFAVDHGLKGSRVSVIEGEVEVREGASNALLYPGDQLSTGNRLRQVPIEDEIAWSRDAAKHRALLRELTQLRRVVARAVDHQPPRTSTTLLDLAPDDTMVYAAMPNLADDLDAARIAFYERLQDSEALSEWWRDQVAANGIDVEIDELLDRLQPLGEAIGAEAVVTVPASMVHQVGTPLFMAELEDPVTFREVMMTVIDEANAESGDHTVAVLIDDPRTASPGEAEVLLWVEGELFAAAGDIEVLRGLARRVDDAGTRGFIGTTLHTRLADAYVNGVSWLLGVDLAGAIAEASVEMDTEEAEALRSMGFLDAETLVVERHRDGEWYATNAEVQFSGPRRGVMAWLAEPAPMGSLDFVSPDAYIAASAVTKDAALMFDDLLDLVSAQDEEAFNQLRNLELLLGIDLRNDLAGSFGGEATFALDGPVLPIPSWKLIIEMYEPETFVNTTAPSRPSRIRV
jgi:ferric-dicitrate binding protein FerR (iron transport regulator)